MLAQEQTITDYYYRLLQHLDGKRYYYISAVAAKAELELKTDVIPSIKPPLHSSLTNSSRRKTTLFELFVQWNRT